MEVKLKEVLKTSKLKRTGAGGQGCISSGDAYETDNGLVYVKKNTNTKARVMFDGEFEGLKAILNTHTVRVPEPYAVVDNPSGGALIAMEFVKMNSLSKYAEQLGEQLARLHKHNEQLMKRKTSNSINVRGRSDDEGVDYVSEFGFHITTCCGYIPQNNTWKIIFDPATFYGHPEYDLSIAEMFGGFPRSFYRAYHHEIPKAPGYDMRSDLYKLFHYINHWNHFGGGYRSSSISTMRRCLKY